MRTMLSNKVVLISGGTGGIGAATCRAMAAHGATVAITYKRNEEAARALTAELERAGRRCLAGQVEGSDARAISAFVARVEQELGPLDVLVNNLGATQVMPFALIEEEDWDEVMTVNLKSMFLFTKAAVRGMIRRRSGAVINLGSIAGQRLLEVPVHYATAKAGVTGFTTSLAKELCRYGVRVNSVVPGLIDEGIGTNVSERQLEDYNRFCALGRPGTAAEVAELIAFVASDRASYINAQHLTIDGGL
jgi:3-oxoacyl-[acyl-carrier protein] reductase